MARAVESLNTENPEGNAGIISKLTFGWMTPLLKTGNKRVLELDDIPELQEQDKTAALAESLLRFVQEEKERPTPSMIRPFWRLVAAQCKAAAVLKFFHDMLIFVSPVFLQLLISYMSDDVTDGGLTGYIYIGVIASSVAVVAIMVARYFGIMYRVGMAVRSGVSGALVKKALRLSSSTRGNVPVGTMVNFLSADTNKLVALAPYVQLLWSSPFQIAISLGLLFRVMGWATLVGLVVMIMIIPMQKTIMMKMGMNRAMLLKFADQRVSLLSEILNGVKIVKLYAWGNTMGGRVDSIRVQELEKLKKLGVLRAFNVALLMSSSVLVALATFTVYILADIGEFTAEKAFTALSLFSILTFPVAFFPMVLAMSIDSKQSVVRIYNFLVSEETPADAVATLELKEDAPAVLVENADFFWMSPAAAAENKAKKALEEEKKAAEASKKKKKSSKGTIEEIGEEMEELPEAEDDVDAEESGKKERVLGAPVLHNVNLTIKKGELVFVVGAVGSGKSSLLEALIGTLHREGGSVSRVANVAFAAQETWIYNASLRENILFGAELDLDKYRSVITSCALREDLKVMSAKDLTQIGEKGINLSGGQKARVALARAVYADADLYLLDDPLSAVDAHVCARLMEDCITGALSDKTRVISTNQLQYLSLADQVVFLDRDGTMLAQGPYNDLMESSEDFRELVESFHPDSAEASDDEDSDDISKRLTKKAQQEAVNALAAGDDMSDAIRGKSDADAGKDIDSGDDKGGDGIAKPGEVLVEQEERAKGAVPLSMYLGYFKAMGGWSVVGLMLASLVMNHVVLILQDYWLSYWVDQDDAADAVSKYLGVYGGLAGAGIIFTGVRMFVLAFATFTASRVLHRALYSGVIRAPMSFFDATPLGRLVNRFSSDVDAIDAQIPDAISNVATSFGILFSKLILVSVILPQFLVALVPLVIVFYWIQKIFRSSMRELRRIESVSKSPVFAYFSETLHGLSTVRAYGREDAFRVESAKRMDVFHAAFYAGASLNRWLEVRLQILGSFVIIIIGCLVVYLRDSFETGTIGLLILYAASIPNIFGWFVRTFVSLEASMNSVERIEEYANDIPQEAAALSPPDNAPPANWPSKGSLEIKDLRIRYREDLPDVLKGISLDIPAGTRLGVVGRTGSGKSTLLVALFRLVEAHQGSVVIDGRDISSQVGLEELRRGLAIVPQDPVMFTGDLRSNLDPFHHSTDEIVWGALRKVEMEGTIKALGGLEVDTPTFSRGQQQLLCLARALIRDAAIVCLDEASASVDSATDQLIQETLRCAFPETTTTITIAHRLDTIIHSTKILVLEQGEVAEYGTPDELLKNPESAFSALVDATPAAAQLRSAAASAAVSRVSSPAPQE